MISQRRRYLVKWPKMKFHFATILNQFAVERVKWWLKSFSNKRRNLFISSEEKATILNKQVLTDESINSAQYI